MQSQRRYASYKEIIFYGIANGGQCIGYNMVRSQLTFFLVTVFGVPAAAVASMIFFMGLWDAFNDPLMGSIVDRTRTRFGKLRPFLLLVPIPLGITTVLFFGGPEFLGDASTGTKIAYMCVTYFLWEFFYTIGDIPFWGMSAAISPSPADRSRAITSARFISSIIGGLPGILISVCIDLSRNSVIPFSLSQVFFALGIFAGTFGMLLFSFSGIFTKERVVQTSDEPKLLDCFKYLLKNKPCFSSFAPMCSARSAELQIPSRSITTPFRSALQAFRSLRAFPELLWAFLHTRSFPNLKSASAQSKLLSARR